MKKKILLSVFLLFAFVTTVSFGQTTTSRKVILSQSPKTVPTGKKWILETGKATKVQVNYQVLTSGDRCNADFLSNPKMISSVNR